MGLSRDGHTLNGTSSGCRDFLCTPKYEGVNGTVVPGLPLGAKANVGRGKGREGGSGDECENNGKWFP